MAGPGLTIVKKVLAAWLVCFLACGGEVLQAQQHHEFEMRLVYLPVDELMNPWVTAIAEDGTVLGIDRSTPPPTSRFTIRLEPGSDEFEVLDASPAYIGGDARPLISTDGPMIWNTLGDFDPHIGHLRTPSIWSEDEQWQPLPGLELGISTLRGISDDGVYAVGGGSEDPDDLEDQPWIWNELEGQVVLPISSGRIGGEARGVSRDGSIVAGVQWDIGGGAQEPRRDFGTRWVNGEPEDLVDSLGYKLATARACSADCSVIIGTGQGATPDMEHPNWRQAWYWTESGGAVYLGTLPEAAEGFFYNVTGISADGSIIIGSYKESILNSAGNEMLVDRGFLWSEETGMVSIHSLLEDGGLVNGGWYYLVPSDITPNGETLLLDGTDREFNPKAAILHLEIVGGDLIPPEARPVPLLHPMTLIFLGFAVLLLARMRLS